MFENFYSSFIKLFAALQSLLLLVVNFMIIPVGDKVDMSKFTDEPVWADEFDGDEMDSSKWNPNFHIADTAIIQRGGYWHSDMVTVEDGSLIITTDYKDNGIDNGPAGYYSSGIDTENLFEQSYGYFEARIQLPKGSGKWAAFWIRSHDGPENGEDIEIDIMEAPNFKDSGMKQNSVVHNVHFYNNYAPDYSKKIARAWIKGDPYSEYHTYGLEWNENEYIFYIDGVETVRRSAKGDIAKECYLMLTAEIGGEDGIPTESWAGPVITKEHLPSQFKIDYVRVYQYK